MGDGVMSAVEVRISVLVATIESIAVLRSVVNAEAVKETVEVTMLVVVVVSVSVEVRVSMDVRIRVTGNVTTCVDTACRVLVVVMMMVGVAYTIDDVVACTVEGRSVCVLGDTPSCWHAVEYACWLRHAPAYLGILVADHVAGRHWLLLTPLARTLSLIDAT